MSLRRGIAVFALFAAIFLLANRSAYRGWFQDDEIDNLSWTPWLAPLDYLKGAVTPLYQPNNFRPAGHFYFYAVEAAAGLNFPVYVAVLHAVHLLNVWLLWLIVRRLGASPLAAASACAFFGLHMALFDDFWKPMYVFDVLCAAFSLTALWCWMRGRWVLSLIAFWLAYKSKELAVMLPLALALYEVWFGNRRWKQLVPFFAISLSFGLQSMLLNPNRDNDYTFRFTAAALTRTLPYYAGRLFLVPYLGFSVPLFAVLARHRRTWFGLAVMALFFFPLLFLPGRVFSAYCYLPLTGLAIALTGVAEALSPAAVAALVILMLPADYRELRRHSRETLARDAGIRAWMGAVEGFASAHPDARRFIFSGGPAGFQRWGIEGALEYFYDRKELVIRSAADPDAAQVRAAGRVALLDWDPALARLQIAY
ncbi:MAG: hypothetical protein JST11_23415 [Acidobacteria bacterium]|nr:hypothetical protein [Acidobacteriota bacterium]